MLEITKKLVWLRRTSPALCDACAPTVILSNTNQQLAFARIAPDKSQVRCCSLLSLPRMHVDMRAGTAFGERRLSQEVEDAGYRMLQAMRKEKIAE